MGYPHHEQCSGAFTIYTVFSILSCVQSEGLCKSLVQLHLSSIRFFMSLLQLALSIPLSECNKHVLFIWQWSPPHKADSCFGGYSNKYADLKLFRNFLILFYRSHLIGKSSVN